MTDVYEDLFDVETDVNSSEPLKKTTSNVSTLKSNNTSKPKNTSSKVKKNDVEDLVAPANGIELPDSDDDLDVPLEEADEEAFTVQDPMEEEEEAEYHNPQKDEEEDDDDEQVEEEPEPPKKKNSKKKVTVGKAVPPPSKSTPIQMFYELSEKERAKRIEKENTRFRGIKAKLADLDKPFDVDRDFDFDEAKLVELLDNMEKLWQVENHADVEEVYRMVRRNLGLNANKMPVPEDVESCMEHVIFQTTALHLRFLVANLVDNSNHKNSKDYERRFTVMYDLQHCYAEMYYNYVRASYLRNHKNTPNSGGIGLFQIVPRTTFDNGMKNDFQKFLVFVLLKLHKAQYRRFGSDIYKPKYYDGHYTGAWERHDSIEHYVASCVNIDRDWGAFVNMTAKPKIALEVVSFLKFIVTDYFPVLEPVRYLLSFRNGVYNIAQAKFYPYGEGSMEYRITDANLITKYKKWVSCNYIDSVFRDLKMMSEIDDIVLKRKVLDENGNEVNEVIKDWRQVDMPKIYGILRKQHIPEEIITGVFPCLMGRGMYWGKELENWQYALFLIGAAGNGKSTLLMLLRLLYLLANVAILSNNIERQWALSAWIGKYILLGFDIKSDCQWEQAEFQSCCTMEEVLVSKKHETPAAWLFNMHIFIACNEFINAWRDNSKSIERRCIALDMPHFVPKDEINPELMKEIMDPIDGEYDIFIQVINMAYRWMTSEYAKKDIRVILANPEVVGKGNETYFEKNSEKLVKSSNPVVSFLESGEVEYGPDEFVSEGDFRRAFERYCKRNGFSSEKNPIRWCQSLWSSPFQKFSLRVTPQKTKRKIDGIDVEGVWIDGLRLKSHNTPQAKLSSKSKGGNKST